MAHHCYWDGVADTNNVLSPLVSPPHKHAPFHYYCIDYDYAHHHILAVVVVQLVVSSVQVGALHNDVVVLLLVLDYDTNEVVVEVRDDDARNDDGVNVDNADDLL